MTTQRRNLRGPFVDEASNAVIADAEAALSAQRADEHGGDDHAGDIIAEIRSLASLRLQLDEHLSCIVTEAREAGCSRRDIAEALGETTTHARRYNTGAQSVTSSKEVTD